MLTRLRVDGFKNLVNVDVTFGPFTCIAGANGVGKSNLFDAILFLAALADRPLMEAASSVRDERHKTTDVKSLFFKIGDRHVDRMIFEAEMIVPHTGQDDLGQRAKATATFLRYRLELGYRTDDDPRPVDRLEIISEKLEHIPKGDAGKNLHFRPTAAWRRSAIHAKHRGVEFLSTTDNPEGTQVKLHQDGGGGRPRSFLASSLPRTVLSTANADESPTVLLARREMQSWRLLQLEPSALRNPDSVHAPIHVSSDGSHMAATLFHLAKGHRGNGAADVHEAAIFAKVANRLSELVEDVHSVRVDEDKQRELLTLQVIDRQRNVHAAKALSDGTLRFLALTILELDPNARGLWCFEEPENGIHPQRIEAMLQLLAGLSVDTGEEIGDDNPLRQVIVNTHSPSVVALVDDADLLVAEPRETVVAGKRYRTVSFAWLDGTWRSEAFPKVRKVSRGKLLAYLKPFVGRRVADSNAENATHRRRRVIDREEFQNVMEFMAEASASE